MPAPASVDELLELIRKSGVVEDGRLTAYMQKLRTLSTTVPKEPNKLAGLMVRDGILTYFQAEQFLQGKWKRFTIGKYKVLEKLGSGGMGQVFLCEHKLMRRRVAVKVLPTAKAEDQSSLERFYREARAAAALDHQNIVRAYDIDQDDNLHFLVMEYVDGASFQELIKKSGPMDVLRACHYIYWAAIGMQHAHEQGIIHRDIKPGNILVDRMGVVKILDMGLARFFHDDEDLITKKFDENVLGTADYLAPEQALDSHTVDGRADIYSLGATFYFLLTAGPPFVEGTVAQKLIWHQNREPKSLKAQRPEVPDGIVKIIAKMMAKDPANRFQTPAELAATLGPWIQTPIAPPPDSEMPMLCPAVLAAGSGMVSSTAMSKNPQSISGGGSTSTLRRPSMSSVHLAPLPAPPLGTGSGNQPAPLVVGEGSRNPPALPPTVEPQFGELSDDSVPGEQVWATFNDTSNDARGHTDRKPNSSHRKQKPAPTKPSELEPQPGKSPGLGKSKLWLWIALGLIVLGGAVGIGLLVFGGGSSSSGKSPQAKTDGPRTIYVNSSVDNVAELKVKTVRRAFEIARAKDQIVIQEENWSEEPLNINSARKDIVLRPEEGKHVTWTAKEGKASEAVFSIGNAENLKVQRITFVGSNLTASVVRIQGNCPEMTFEDVELVDGRDFGLKLLDCQGVANRPITLSRVRILKGTNTPVGIGFQGTSSKVATRFVKVDNCRLEGPFKAAFQFDGHVTNVDVIQNRILNGGVGVFAKKPFADQPMQFSLSNNTFHTLTGPFVQFEASEPFTTPPPTAGKFKFEFTANYLFNATAPLVFALDGRPLPPVTLTGNYRNAASDPLFPTTQLDLAQFATDPNQDATFLRSEILKTASPTKTPVGATGP